MGIVKGLGAINKYNADREAAREAANAPKVTWFQLKKDKESAQIRFLQELDGDSKFFSAKNDLGFIAVEHTSPADYKRKALCSLDDEGQCYACDMHRKKNAERDPEYKGGWKQKSRLYINVLVKVPGEDPFVAVLSQGTAAKSVTPTLLEYAGDSGGITNRWWKITRNGTGLSDTSYTLVGRDPDDEVNVEDYDLFDLEKVVRKVPYDQQENHYGVSAPAAEARPTAAVSADPDAW